MAPGATINNMSMILATSLEAVLKLITEAESACNLLHPSREESDQTTAFRSKMILFS